jgi:sugar O-acyltransferase (sialic acid O-acetyltransferase NeuD family)
MTPALDMTTQRTLILGAGGHGRVVLDILLQDRSTEIVGFLDNNEAIHGRRIDGIPVLGPIGELAALAAEHDANGAIIAIGDNGTRRGLARWIDQTGVPMVSAIHPSATLAQGVTVGRNTVICAGVVACAHCQIGDSVILNTGCIIDHYTTVGEGSHICPGVRIGGRVRIEPGVFVGIGATVIQKITLGCEAIIGAGAVVIEDIPALATAVGVPAHAIKLASATEEEAAMLLPAQV